MDNHMINSLKKMMIIDQYENFIEYEKYNTFIKIYNVKSLYLHYKYGRKLFYKILEKRMNKIIYNAISQILSELNIFV